MDRANNLPKIQDEERESMFGYVYGVSGPGRFDSIRGIYLEGLFLSRIVSSVLSSS